MIVGKLAAKLRGNIWKELARFVDPIQLYQFFMSLEEDSHSIDRVRAKKNQLLSIQKKWGNAFWAKILFMNL